MKKLVIVFIILVILISGFFLYFQEGILPVNSKNVASKIFVIQKGERVSQIAKNLERDDLIRNKIVFYLVVKQLGIENTLQAGDFRLASSMNVYEIARSLTKGTLDVWITIVEGLRKEEIAHLFSTALGFPESEFLKSAREGYLFPDTYLIPREATIDVVMKILKDNFNLKYTQELRDQAIKKNLSDDQIITIASLVEREAKFDKDRKLVAAIIYKRFKNDWPLQIDATIQYTLGYQPIEKTWWKKALSAEDVQIESPYNTYKNPGLPPAPIANPGLASIKAVVEADESTPYWYYLSDKAGVMHYAKTLEEHDENISRYLQ